MHRIAYFSPFTNTENEYIALQQDVLRKLGFEVRPLSLGALLKGRCGGLWNPANVVWVHWLENRLFVKGSSARRPSLAGAAQFVLYVLVLVSARARIFYVVHDHDVHDVAAAWHWLSRGALRLLRRIADERVVHDPTQADRYAAVYAPHPLYREPEVDSAPSPRDTPRFAAMGAIRSYKALDRVLEAWPHGVPLLIAGKGDDSYVATLREIVASRGLGDQVTIDARFLSDDEFHLSLTTHDVLLLPHLLGENLVSGAFFAAMGHVRVVIARESTFIAWAARELPGVRGYTDDASLPDVVEAVIADWPRLRETDQATQALAHFGHRACLDAYGALVGATVGAPLTSSSEGRYV